MLIKRISPSDCKESDVTDERIYLGRREIIKAMGFFGAGSLLASSAA
ncbi:MAG TPA: mononuclear molybdenum enzyme YedY, partial [Porticoccaceae bacterium]|nr:mononuclear molybdenum enzyme YedY [Porticoccaceae bacterium]